MSEPARRPAPPRFHDHGAATLPAVTVDSYNAELRTPEGFLGDRASSRAFRGILDAWRRTLREAGQADPLGEAKTIDIPRRRLDELLASGEPEVAGLVHS